LISNRRESIASRGGAGPAGVVRCDEIERLPDGMAVF